MISKDYEQRVERGRETTRRGVVLVSGAVTCNKGRGHDRYEASPRNPTPRVLYTFAPTLAPASSQLDDSSRPEPPRNDDLFITARDRQPARHVLLTVVVAVSSSGYLVRVLRPLSLEGSGRGAHGAGGQGGYRGRGREAVLTPRARGARGLGEEEKRRSERSE